MSEIVTLVTTLHQSAMAACLAMEAMTAYDMNPPIYQQRLCWSKFIEEKICPLIFTCHLRMSKGSFHKLLSYLQPELTLGGHSAKAWGRGGPIMPEMRLYATLCYLAGGSYTDIHFFCGISESSFINLSGR